MENKDHVSNPSGISGHFGHLSVTSRKGIVTDISPELSGEPLQPDVSKAQSF